MTDPAPSAILKTAPAPREIDIAQALRWVRQAHGKSALTQVREIAALALSRQRLEPKDYYIYGLFRDGIAPEERAAYISSGGNAALNERLSPPHLESQHSLMANKVLTGLVLDRAGLPTTPILALYSPFFAIPSVPGLRDEAAIAAFLGEGSALPCFGKPACSSLAMGAVMILEAEDGGRRLRLGDGRLVETAALAGEIARHFPKGYIFQPLIRQHPDVEAYNGRTVGVLRVATIRGRNGPELFYASFRIPPKGATNDGVTGKPNTVTLVDPATGRILRGQDIAKFATSPATASPATGKPLSELVLPHLGESIRVSIEAHRAFPAHGALGIDIALGIDGPLINEINARPFHYIYQRAADRGLLNPDFAPRIDEAIAVSRELAPGTSRRRRRFRLRR